MFRNAFRLHARASAAKKQQQLMQQILTKQSRRLTAEVIAEIIGTKQVAAAVVPTNAAAAWESTTMSNQEDPLSGVYFDLQSLRFAMAEQQESATSLLLLPPSIEETAATETPAPMSFQQAPALMTCVAQVAVPAELDVSQVWESTAVGGEEIVELPTASHTATSPVVHFLPEEIIEQPTANAMIASGGSDTMESDAIVAEKENTASVADEPTTSEVSAASEGSPSYQFGYPF